MEANIIRFVLLFGAASTLGIVFLFINKIFGPNGLLGPKTPVSPLKFETFECGNVLNEDARVNFNVKFYVVAILFLVFDMETVFLALLTPIFSVDPKLALIGLLLFTVTLVEGFVYILRKGGLDWK